MKNNMCPEFRAVPQTSGKGDLYFDIEYSYDLDKWLKLEDFNEAVVNVIVKALNDYAKSNRKPL